MKHMISRALMGTAFLAAATVPARADEVTVQSILIAQGAGAAAGGIISVINDPATTVAVTPGDIVTLRAAGVPDAVITAIEARAPVPGVALQPDDARLADLVRLMKSGISEAILLEHVQHSGAPFELSSNDLLYLKQNGVLESTIGALMATSGGSHAAPRAPGAAPAVPRDLTFDDLVLVGHWFHKDRVGRLVMGGDTLSWVVANDADKNFTFQIAGLEKVWFTCQTRTPENFCYQIVNGARFPFRDGNGESGSNASVVEVMEALRKYFPQVAFGPPDATKG
ncbi:MAG TPA: hypothetical protein VFV75_12275 [Candidatus Polarisedimenticolaceae bacterium]|nr:hypothetical protein [Candidatus Polarisedimenticolaceae bacterium]